MPPKTYKTDFNFEDMDWEAYTMYRPLYSSSIFDMIYSHQQTHDFDFGTALDIGAGNGVVAKELLHHFNHVIFSDASEQYIRQARHRFGTVPPNRISFSRWRFGDKGISQTPPAAAGSIDLIAAGECIHYAPDLDVLVDQVASLLKSDGTFATFQYGFHPVFALDNGEISSAYAAFMDKWYDTFGEAFEKQDTVNSPAAICNSRLDTLHFPPDLWKNVRRYHTLADHPVVSARLPKAESGVVPGLESEEVLEDEKLISRVADYAWLEGYLDCLYPPMDIKTRCGKELEDLRRAMGSKRVELAWPFDLVVATRR